ncbi:MAG: AAA family ATPase [Lachnospiraceae bacterium]|nr:AAA family ATPase [Lachnospiraceae bacterium]
MINRYLYPTVKYVEKGKKNVYRRVMRVMPYTNEDAPYIKDAGRVLDEEHIPEEGRFLIVSRSMPAAVKAAKHICDNYPGSNSENEEYEEIEYELEFDLDEYDSDLNTIDLIDLSVVKDIGIVPANAYLEGPLDEANGDIAMYAGLDTDEDIKNKIDAILADYRVKKFIYIPPEKLNAPWAVYLQMHKGFIPVVLEDIPDSYFEEVFDKIREAAGAVLEEGLTASTLVKRIKKLRGDAFQEEDLDWMIEHAVKAASKRGNRVLKPEDFVLNGVVEESAAEKLRKMPGLKNVKDMVTEFVSLRKETDRNDQLKGMHSNMIFYGNPGTGKSTCAELIPEILADEGISNTAFVKASRADIIGKYVGHTAVKVSELFDRARGGILFVDEAGFFLNEGAGGYVQEAVKEFVRFMELYPDVAVIFAMYEKEAALFMDLDEGIASRISRMVHFEDYSGKEFKEIFVHMLREKGYSVNKTATGHAMGYIESLKRGRNFGNAREVRKLAESVIIAHSVRIHSETEEESDKTENVITVSDIKKGIERLESVPERRKSFGFDCSRAAVLHQY